MLGISFGPLHVEISTFRVEVHYYYHSDQITSATLSRIEEKIDALAIQSRREERKMTVQLDALRSEVARNTSVDQSVATLLDGLTERIAALEPTQEAIDALVNDLRTSNDATAAAVTRNTPAETAPSGGATPTGEVPGGGTVGGTTTPTGGNPGGTNLDTTQPSGEGGSVEGGGGGAGTSGEGSGTGGSTTEGAPTP